MGNVLFFDTVGRDELKEGDHIFYWCNLLLYSHHGIYIGKNKVIHFMRVTDEGSGSTSTSGLSAPGASELISRMKRNIPLGSKSISVAPAFASVGSSYAGSIYSSGASSSSSNRGQPSTCPNPYYCRHQIHGTGVILSCLDCFLGGSGKVDLCRYQYGVSRKTFEVELRGGTCSTAESDPPKEVVSRAKNLLVDGFGNYDLRSNNCEDFALYCKTGLLVTTKTAAATSGQINSVVYFLSSFLTDESIFVQFAKYCSRRYSRDIGVRKDVVKVAVGDVASFLNSRDREGARE